MIGVVLAVAGILAAVIAAGWWSPAARRYRAARRDHVAFAAANGLSARQSALLWKVARQQRLADPLQVFLRPSRLANAPALGAEDRAELRAKLFGG